MSTRLATLVLAGFATIFSYIVYWMGYCLRPIYMSMYRIKWADLDIFMPAISRTAADHAWLFPVLIFLACFAAIFLAYRYQSRAAQFMVIGLCTEALITWIAMFSYFYDDFLGPVSMAHPQRFDPGAFITFAFSAFPVTLAAILLPMIIALRNLRQKP